MNLEDEIFKRAKVIFDKLEDFGFKKKDNCYILERNILNNDFKAVIIIDLKGNVSGKVIDLETNDEYVNIRTKMSGEFVNRVRESYKNILIDIRNNCFERNYFIFDQTNRINKYIKTKYNSEPEFLWEKFPGYAIYRNSKKWFALIGNVQRNKVDKVSGSLEEIEVINLKINEDIIDEMLLKRGYYEAYHMNKRNWVSIILDDTLNDDTIISLLDDSYNLVN